MDGIQSLQILFEISHLDQNLLKTTPPNMWTPLYIKGLYNGDGSNDFLIKIKEL